MATPIAPDRVVKRVLTKVAMGQGGCHVSTYSVASHGYAQVGWHEAGNRVVTLCHRVIWQHFNGPIPEGMTVDHMCKNRRCIRLRHLRLLPNVENARRTSGRDWVLGECINGHDDALHWRPAGPSRVKGYCAACRAAGRQAYEAKYPERVRATRSRSAARKRARKRLVA